MVAGSDDIDLDELMAQTEQQVAALGQLQQRIAEVTGEARGPRDLAFVRTTSAGLLTELVIDPDGMRLEPSELAEEIVAATRAAAAQATGRIAEISQELLGRDLISDASADVPQPPELPVVAEARLPAMLQSGYERMDG
ncbi:MAG TPA: YbaB/EbfC family nucleoid-associated protein [Micromonosporaceae bacterium]|nr:YbaB/EbfC family nucleoid-associated protein [Micromonosporaceae bacterium]